MLKRTLYCGQVAENLDGREVILNGWVENIRDHGGVLFIDLRDRKGVIQVVLNPEFSPSAYATSRHIRDEYVLGVRGIVRMRPEDSINPAIPTGRVEVFAQEVEIQNTSLTPPLAMDDRSEAGDIVRLRYRYLDLRRPTMQHNLVFRSKALAVMRQFLQQEDFIEIETPVLTRSTPEGARDFLVPSRLNSGQFYALPQSPQIFKQLLMVAGLERYYQVVKCFRDEDLRADRQPEFTQLDLEMSFVEEKDVMDVIERLLARLFNEIMEVEVKLPFPQITFCEAMEYFGTDKPDLRCNLVIKDLSTLFTSSSFRPFQKAVEEGGKIKGLKVPGGASLSKRELEELIDLAIKCGTGGLSWIRIRESDWQSPLVKLLTPAEKDALTERLELKPGDLAVFVAGHSSTVSECMGTVRLELGHRLNLINQNCFRFCWVTDFPLFSFDPELNCYESVHHPFTSPREEDFGLLSSDPLQVQARAYDLVLNGNEVGGGSIRIHKADIQEKIFNVLSSTGEELRKEFEFLLEALRLGAPPHGGIALGVDRIMMIMLGKNSIREVIAFPKTHKGACPLTRAPAPVSGLQLNELGIRVVRQ
jgi:aspartyl-tRNA synthetase